MAASNVKQTAPESKLMQYTLIELKDPHDAYLEACFAAIYQNRYNIDSNILVQIGQTNKNSKEHISHALLYGILTDVNKAKCFQDLLALNGTNLTSIIAKLEALITRNWRRIFDSVRQQLLWFLRETLAANIDGIDRLYYVFLRQINPHEQCIELCDAIIDLLAMHPLFLKTYPEMKLLTIYSFLCIFPIYLRRKPQARQIEFILNLTRENIHCLGRDAIRLLMQLGHVREIDAFLKHLSQNTSPDFLPKLLALQTEPKYLALPLSFNLEKNLQFLLDNCRTNSQEKYYFEWFQNQYLNFKQQPDCIFLCAHIIRYVCVVCRNQLNPNRLTRWSFISWLLTQLSNYQQALQQTIITASQTAMNAAAVLSSSTPQLMQINEQITQCRLAIYYDWFLFDMNAFPQMTNEFDIHMNSTVVGYHLLTVSYYHAKHMLLFLLYTSENLIASLKPFLQQNVARVFLDLFQRIPILNAQQLLQMFTHDRDTYQRLLATFFSLTLPAPITTASTNDDVMIINDDTNPNAAMPLSADDDSSEVMILSSNATAAPRFSDDEDDDDYDSQLKLQKAYEHDYDDDDDVLMITEDTKATNDLYTTNLSRTSFPFDRFRSFINEHVHQLAVSYSVSTSRNKSSLSTQICKQIVSSLSDKRPLILHTQASDPAGPISSYAMSKHEKTSEKFQSRLLTILDEQTIVHGLLCLWLFRDSFPNRLLPSPRISQTDQNNSMLENDFRNIPAHKLKRSVQNLSVCALLRGLKDDSSNPDVYIKLLQAMYFFQPELAYVLLYYLSIDVSDLKMAAELFERFARDIIKLSSSYRKQAVPPAKTPTYDQDFIDFMHEVLSQCEQDDTETFLYLFSFIYRIYSKRVLNNIKLIRLLLHTINQFELEQFMLDILKHRLQLFNAHKLYSIVDQTLLFAQTEQEDFWKLLGAHDFVQNDYEQLFTNIIEHLLNQSKSVVGEQRLAKSANYNTHRNTIAVANVFDILKTKTPTYGLVCCLFAHEITANFSEKLCLLWQEQHHDIFWRHLERILQKWIQRENDPTKQKIDYKIGTIKMASDNGLKFILQHLHILLQHASSRASGAKIDLDESKDRLTIDDSPMVIPLSTSTIKSLIGYVHKQEQLYTDNKTFVDRFENGNSVLPPPAPSPTAATTAPSVKRRKVDNKS